MSKKKENMISAKRLKELREKTGMSQSELARLSGYTPQTISYYETGNRRITYEAARIFSTILHTRVEYIMGEDDFPDETSAERSLFTDIILKDLAFEILLKTLSVSIADRAINMQELPPSNLEDANSLHDSIERVGYLQSLRYLWLYKNKCIAVTEKESSDLRNDVLDYLQYKLERIFQNHNALTVPNDISFTSYESSKAAASLALSGELWNLNTEKGTSEDGQHTKTR